MALQGSSGLSYTLPRSSSLIHDARLKRLEECRVHYRGLVGRGRVRRLLERAATHLSSILLLERIQLCPRGHPQRTGRHLPPCRSLRVSPRPLHSLLLHLLLSSASCSFRRWLISFFTIRLKLELGWQLRRLPPLEQVRQCACNSPYNSRTTFHPVHSIGSNIDRKAYLSQGLQRRRRQRRWPPLM